MELLLVGKESKIRRMANHGVHDGSIRAEFLKALPAVVYKIGIRNESQKHIPGYVPLDRF